MRTMNAVFLALVFLLPWPLALAQWSSDPTVNTLVTGVGTAQGIVSDGVGGAIVVWDNGDIYAQRVSPSGKLLWTASGVPICTDPAYQYAETVGPDGAGGAIIAWIDFRDGGVPHIYAQRVDSGGTTRWTPNGVPVFTVTNVSASFPAPVVSDGAGGAIIAWEDNRSGGGDIYAQRINAAGVVQWTINGVPVCRAPQLQRFYYPSMAKDGMGGAIMAWEDYRTNPAKPDIYAQRIDGSGARLWDTTGVIVCADTNSQSQPNLVSDGLGGAVITWFDARNGIYNGDIFAQRIDARGYGLWAYNGVPVCTAANRQAYPAIASDGMGGAIMTWEDNRSGSNYDIYAQYMEAGGNPRWPVNGVAISTAYNPSGNSDFPSITSDGLGGAIISLNDDRNATTDVFAQRINSAGVVQWKTNGVSISTAANSQYQTRITSDGKGGAILAWWDNRNDVYNNSVYLQNVDRNGYLGDASPQGIRVKDVPNDQGGKVEVLWNHSYLDAWPNRTVTSYTLWRGVNALTGIAGRSVLGRSEYVKWVMDNPSGAGPYVKLSSSSTTTDTLYWESVANVAPHWLTGYSLITTTPSDSGPQGVARYYYMITANTNDSLVYWDSAPASGYSVDNLPPIAPRGATISALLNGSIALAWNRDRLDPDVGYYSVYRSRSGGFVPGPSNLLKNTTDTTAVDSTAVYGQAYYYRITTIDIHGNQSPPSAELSATALAVQMTSFTATSNRLAAEIHWTTATELNNYGFTVERKVISDGSSSGDWVEVGFVAGGGTTNSPREYSFVDRSVTFGRYAYRLKQILTGGSWSYTQSIEVEVGIAPKEFTLAQNYPNPFNPETSIEFTLAQDGKAVVKVYNWLGQEVATLFDAEVQAGRYYRVKFDGSRLASGTYITRLVAGGKQLVKKMLLLK